MERKILEKIVLYIGNIAEKAGGNMSWGGWYQPELPKELKQRIEDRNENTDL